VILAPHGHSLYVNSLAERGLLGLGSPCDSRGVAIAQTHRVPNADAPPLHWAYWCSAGAAWIITIVVGALNTTLHHEQALLCMLLLGGWLSLSRPSAQPLRAKPA
jgi:hypothetical protein